jgi:hypothetical protein
MQNATGSVVELDDKVTDVTESVKAQTLALGENSKEWLAQAVMKDDVVQKKFESWFDQGLDLDALAQQANVKISDMIGMALADPGKGAQDYLSAWFADGLIPPEYRDQLYGDLNDIAAALDDTTEAGLRNTKIWKALKGATGAAGDGLDDFENNLNDTIKRVYTLTDYVGDLSTILGAAFTIRYGSVEAIDKLETSWAGVADRLSEAKKQMQAINQEISAMTADKNILEYQLNIALKYGDTLRADKIRAELEAKRSEITDKQTEYNKAAEDASTGLTGNSRGAIANRETMRGLVGDYNSELAALANEYSKYTGKNQKADRDRIKAKADALKSEFKTKAMGLGFAENELAPYVKSFEDFKTIVNKLPNTLTLKVVADPGTRAFMEWWAKSSENPANQTPTAGKSEDDKKKKPKGQSGKVLGYNPSTNPIEDLKPEAVRGPTQAQQAGGFWYDVGNVGLNIVNFAVQPVNFAASAFTPSSWNGESSYMGNVEKNWFAGNGGSKDNIWGSNAGKSKWTGYDAEYQQADYEKRLATWNKNHALPKGYKESDRAGLAAKHKKMYPGHYNPYDGSVNFYKEPPVVKKFGRPLADLASVHAALNPGKFNPYTEVVNPINLNAAQKKAASAWKDAKSLAELGKEHAKLYPGEYNPYTHSVNPGVIDISKSNNKEFADYLQHGGKSTDPMYVKNVNESLYKNAKDSPKDGWGNLREGWKLAGYNERGDAVYEYEKKAMGGFVGKGYDSGGRVIGPGTGTSDSVPAMLSRGEYVIKADAAKALGPYVLNALNSKKSSSLKLLSPAAQSHNEFMDAATGWWKKAMQKRMDKANGDYHGLDSSIKNFNKLTGSKMASDLNSWKKQASAIKEIYRAPSKMPGLVAGASMGNMGFGGGGGGLIPWDKFSAGGLVVGRGSSTSDSIPAMLSNGEYVLNAMAVKTYGIDFLNALNRMQSYRQSYGSQQSASSGSGNIVVELSPEAVNQLMAMSNRPINLYSDDRQIATSANRGNRLLAMRGSN